MESCIITTVKFGTSKLEFSIPESWSINKVKCLLVSQIPSLNFDEFELVHMGKLLRGTYRLRQVIENALNIQQIDLEITKMKSEIKLSDYYKSTMGRFMGSSAYNKQPVLSLEYQKYRNIIENEAQDPNNPNPDINQQIDQQEANAGNPANPLFRALRLIGIYFVMVLLWDHGKAYQLAIIALVVLIYYGIQIFVKYRQRKIKKNASNDRKKIEHSKKLELQNDDQKIEANQNKIKGVLTLYYYKSIEIVFCFLMTFFPNLSIEMHLQINKQKIEKAREKVNHLLPNSYVVQVNSSQNH